jgi:hypothetical protein
MPPNSNHLTFTATASPPVDSSHLNLHNALSYILDLIVSSPTNAWQEILVFVPAITASPPELYPHVDDSPPVLITNHQNKQNHGEPLVPMLSIFLPSKPSFI